MVSKVQKVLQHLRLFNIQKLDKVNYYYQIEELKMGTLSVTKVNTWSRYRNSVLTDEEVLTEFLPEVVLDFTNLEVLRY